MNRQGLAGLIHQSQDQGNHHRLLVGLARGGGGVLANQQLQLPGLAVPVAMNLQAGGAGLAVPVAELLEIKAR